MGQRGERQRQQRQAEPAGAGIVGHHVTFFYVNFGEFWKRGRFGAPPFLRVCIYNPITHLFEIFVRWDDDDENEPPAGTTSSSQSMSITVRFVVVIGFWTDVWTRTTIHETFYSIDQLRDQPAARAPTASATVF